MDKSVVETFSNQLTTGSLRLFDVIVWTEPFILCILGFHLLFFIGVYFSWNRTRVQCILLCIMSVLVLCSEYVNTYCRNHWKDLASQNYFDSAGVFSCIIISAPLLAGGLILLIRVLWQTSCLLVIVKRKQLQERLKINTNKQCIYDANQKDD